VAQVQANVSNGVTMPVSLTVPGGTRAGSYTVQAVYSDPGNNFVAALPSTTPLTIQPVVTPSTANLPTNAALLTINGDGFDSNTADDSVTFDNSVIGTVTSATATSLTVSLSGLSGLTAGTALHASVTVNGVSSGSPVQVATIAPAVTSTTVQAGQSAGIGFWHNKNGQTLIDSFNGGDNSTALADWLATTFPNLYGANAGVNNLTGKTNDQVAAFSESLFHESGMKLDAQVLATALNVYATTQSLGGTAAAAYGFTVDAYGLGADWQNIGFSRINEEGGI
jgi:hypothetical protein